MRFESVTAHAFGPFVEKTLTFTPGLNVFHGPNESGKSSWHAALYAVLCGMRRGRGQARSDDRRFTERHRPWSGTQWLVSGRVRLEDGRTIELRHDLAGMVDCRAIDTALGRDVSAEIISAGSPDGSRWLGLDRQAFLATACMRQADLLEVQSDLLQEYLQRAADNAGRDETAAGALALIDQFLREQVGQNRSNSTKPLRVALNALEAAKSRLERARQEHQDFLDLSAQYEQAAAAAAAAETELRIAQAAHAGAEADASARRYRHARDLAAKYPAGEPRSPVKDDGGLAQEVTSAISVWDRRPSIPVLSGESADEIRGKIAALPQAPEGDLKPAPAVLEAEADFADLRRRLELYRQTPPAAHVAPDTGGATAGELRNLAHDLSVPEPVLAPEVQQRVEQATQALGEARRKRGIVSAGAASAVVGGVIAAFVGHLLPALLLVMLAAAAGVWAYRLRTALIDPRSKELREAELARDSAVRAHDEWTGRISETRARARAFGLAPEAAVLLALAAEIDRAQAAAAETTRWRQQESELVAREESAASTLAAALQRRGVAIGGDVEDAARSYLQACEERARIAAQAARRGDLERQLAAREAAENAQLAAREAHAHAAAELRDSARRCGLGEIGEEQQIVAALRRWLDDYAAQAAAYEAAYREWAELRELLRGRTLEELGAEADRQRQSADELSAGLPPDEGRHPEPARELSEEIERRRREYAEARRLADRLLGQVSDRNRQLTSVADAEEECELAAKELARVQRLERTLITTREFLAQAQERIHRDIAPVLAATVKEWLPLVTADRYSEVAVDPGSLTVTVKDGDGGWRDATQLSHGTAEQIFLLLRMAMARHLTRNGEVCPLLLDDITVQFDTLRTEAVLTVLHAISRERQVILFTQEDAVVAWASANLSAPHDQLVSLGGAAGPETRTQKEPAP